MSSIVDSFRATAHSAQVNLRLEVAGRSLPIAQLASDFLIPETRATLAPCQGVIVMSVDGSERRWDVLLPDGLNPAIQRARIERV